MRVLKFLVNSDLNLLIQKLVNYLVDAGHFVYVNPSSIDESSKWGKKYKHNLNIIDHEKANLQELDYVIDFSNFTAENDLFKINFDLIFTGNTFFIKTLLNKRNKSAVIYTRTGELNSFNPLESNLEHLVNEITELFIDTVIYLLRIGNDTLIFNNKVKNNGSIGSLIRYEHLLEQLNLYYKSLENNDNLFFIHNLSTINDSHISYVESKLKLDIEQICFTKANLEVFILYILTLLNSRKENIYGYDFCSVISNDTREIKQLSKFIEVNLSDSYNDLFKKCNNNIYDIINDNFYSGITLYNRNIKPGIIISYDCDFYDRDYLLSIAYNSKGNELTIKYRKELYYFEDFEKHFKNFIDKFDEFISNNIRFNKLLNLSQNYLNLCLIDWNKTDKEYISNKTVHELFEEQVKMFPDNIAIVYEDTKLTYRELNERANQLASFMVDNHNIQPEMLVALCLDRSEIMLIAILAVLKAGGAYVPLDPNYPDERIRCILEDSNAVLVITNEIYKPKLEKLNNSYDQVNVDIRFQRKTLVLDDKNLQKQLSLQPTINLKTKTTNANIVYVIYTSGTTGNPKGVIIEHKALINILTSVSNKVSFTNKDRLLAVTTIAFDIAALEIFMPLMLGGELVITSQKDLVDTYKLIELIEKLEITIVQATPSLWYLITQVLNEKKLHIRALCGGEDLPLGLAKVLTTKVNKYWNVYGPTETTVWSTIKEILENDQFVSIGSPISNTKCYVLDANLIPLPTGVIGELYIGGAGLARGYLNNPDLTAEKFIPNPFQTSDKNPKLYRTGDLVKWLPNGDLEYINRSDFQVKIRGYRVELEEIENQLSSYPAIKQSVVVVKEDINSDSALDGRKRLVGYYVSAVKLDDEDILSFLQTKLPEYMIPTILMHLEKLPLNINNKLDRKILPEPEFQCNTSYAAPRNELESQLCKIWIEVLGLLDGKENIRGDFFKLGGNSILAIRLVSKINNEFQSDIKIRDIFYARTIEQLSSLVRNSTGDFIYKDYLINELNNADLFESFPLNNIQQAYYFGRFSNFELSSVSTHVYSEYKYEYLNIEKLEKSLNQLINRHLALRTIFVNGYQKYIKEPPYYKVEIHELENEKELIEIRNRFSHKVYSPELYPLFDVFVTRFRNYCILHISFDALIIDMSSFQILFAEWSKLYSNPDLILPNLNVSHRDYILQYEKVRNSELFLNAEKYWASKVDDYDLEMNLPLLCHVSQIKNPKFTRITKTISATIWSKLLDKIQQKNISATALILEIYGKILCYWTGQNKLCINVNLFSRLPLHTQINEIIGDFTILELFNYIENKRNTIGEELQNTHDSLWNDIEHSLFDGIDFQRLVRSKRSIPNNQIVAPVVLTSVLGHDNVFDLYLDKSYQGVNYSISQTAQVWLDNKAYATEEGLVAEWDYVEQLFDKELIEAMHNSYCNLIEYLADKEWDIEKFPSISLPDKNKKLIEIANNSEQNLSSDTLFSRYEEIVKKYSLANNVAVIDEATKEEYNHGKLLKECSLLAQYILYINSQKQVIQQNHTQSGFIGILSEKDYNQILSTLAIMKSNHGYLPLNSNWPLDKLDTLLEQSKVSMLLISKAQYNKEHIREFLSSKYQLLVIEEVLLKIANNDQLRFQIEEIELPIVDSNNAACVILSSDLTKKFAGVTLSHKGVLNTIDAINNRFDITKKDKVLALSEFSLDLSMYDIFGMLAVGGTIILPEQDAALNPAHWLEVIKRYQVTIWNTVPHLAGLLIDEIDSHNISIGSIKLFLLSGDKISVNLPNKIEAHCPNATIMSLGNITEGSVWSTWYKINSVKEEWNSIPYGVAMPNQKIYILNEDCEHCPLGIIGEIYIGGAGIALNYSGNEEQTNSSFVKHVQLGRLYKTGKLGRWHRDSYVEFIGIKNDQTRLNGYRVQLEEISTKLSKLEGVEEAVVKIQKEDGQDYIVGYLFPKSYGKRNKKEQIFDKEAFKVEQHGILTNLQDSHKLEPDFNELQYRLRKSYRNFISDTIELNTVVNIGNKVITDLQSSVTKNKILSKKGLISALLSISGIKLKDRILPKYRYPSGGSSYSIRCFLTTVESLGDINPGYYYYNPVEYTLCMFNNNWQTTQSKIQNHPELHLVVNWPSIRPLYGDEFSKKLAYIEIGHMLSLLLESLDTDNIKYEVKILEEHLDKDNTLVAKIILGVESTGLPKLNLRINYLRMDDKRQCYTSLNSDKYFDLEKQSIFVKAADEFRQLFNGQLLITLEGEELKDNLALSGMIFQRISESLYEEGIGSCMLGLTPYKNAIYSMVLGKISDNEKGKASSNAQRTSIQQVINQKLSIALPEYLLPYNYIVLDALPLDAHGVLDINILPKLQIKENFAFAPPRNKIETKMCRIWEEVLGLSEDKIGIHGDFFRLGGNSLLAMQVVRRLNKELEINLKLNDLYKLKMIEDISNNFHLSDSISFREEGII